MKRSEEPLRTDPRRDMDTPPPVEEAASAREEAEPAVVVDAAAAPTLDPVESPSAEPYARPGGPLNRPA